jgi:phosphoenolpyruvate carboxykinase (ATP)
MRYARMLGEKLARHDANCWLVNTGWTGGGVGVGQRMNLTHTRAMVHAALNGALVNTAFGQDAVFRVAVPKACPNVPAEVLSPRATWRSPVAYDAKAAQLAGLFNENFAKFSGVSPEIAAAAPTAATTVAAS